MPQFPPEHSPEAHCDPLVQVPPLATSPQLPDESQQMPPSLQLPEAHCEFRLHGAPFAPTHTPAWQSFEAHSAPVEHEPPPAVPQTPGGEHVPESHWFAAVQLKPFGLAHRCWLEQTPGAHSSGTRQLAPMAKPQLPCEQTAEVGTQTRLDVAAQPVRLARHAHDDGLVSAGKKRLVTQAPIHGFAYRGLLGTALRAQPGSSQPWFAKAGRGSV